jgi:outer membrane protein TolC
VPLAFVPFLLALALLAGCRVDQKKEVQLYRDVLDRMTDGKAPRYAPGEPLTLEKTLALTNWYSEQLAIRGENYLQALIAKDRAASAFFPTISLAPSYYRQDPVSGSSGANIANKRFDVPVNGNMNLFNGFRDIANVRLAAYTIEQQRWLLLDMQQEVLLDVARTYYQVLRAEGSVQVLRNSLRVQEERVRDMQAKQRVGNARPLDVAQTEAEAAATRVSLVQAISDVRNGRNTLAFLVGAPVADSPLLDRYQLPAEVPSVDDLLKSAHESREDYRAAFAAVQASRQNVEAAIGQYYPSVTLNVNYFLYRESLPSASDWNAILQANLPIFTGGLIHANVRTAWSQLRQARLEESLLDRQITQDVQVAYENLRANAERIKELQVQLAASQQAFNVAERQYQIGLATNLERLTAQDNLLSTQLQLTQAQFDRKIFYLDLQRVSGRLRISNPEEQPGLTTQPATRGAGVPNELLPASTTQPATQPIEIKLPLPATLPATTLP